MFDLKWSASEQKVARSAYEQAVDSTFEQLMAEFQARAAAVATPSDMWEVEDYLRQQRRRLGNLFDYRYSQLPWVFAQFIHEGHLDEARLSGLSDEKLEIIRHLVSVRAEVVETSV